MPMRAGVVDEVRVIGVVVPRATRRDATRRRRFAAFDGFANPTNAANDGDERTRRANANER